ncbi:MAG: glycoside hydrolase family 127 protein [Saprospiraceae bacterium]|nr:glycoside hydrolase family 127 protein [Saprospiraceae bacterium]
MKFVLFFSITVVLSAAGFIQHSESENTSVDLYADYPINPVDIRHVKINDQFWLPIIKRVQENTIDYAIHKCSEEGRFDNFLIAGGVMDGEVKGHMPFDDTDVYKIIEGACNSLISAPNEKLEILLDSLITIIATGQEADGYLTTWRTINPAKPPADWVKVVEGKRWESLAMSHEFYNAGHLYEAAAVHFLATGKRNFLDIALKNADLMVKTFGPGKIETVPGHQIIETGLIKLYRITHQEKYLQLARYFLDGRGDYVAGRSSFGTYAQDHLPVIEQDEVVGHAVRAMYMYAGMTDIAAIYRDEKYHQAIEKLWENMVYKKMYLTGGIGALHQGEAFGENYDLPNLTAYNETCAAIGSVYWNHRLFMLDGQVKYYDVIERTLYNGLISGLSLDGEKFFYPNALESDGLYKFNQGACTRQSWFDCSCCPTNIIRFVPAIPGLIYSKIADMVYVNLYIGSHAEIDVNGQMLSISQETNYPWDGKIKMSIKSSGQQPITVKLRIPGWARNEVLPGDLYHYTDEEELPVELLINDHEVPISIKEGYLMLTENWSKPVNLMLNLPMQARLVEASQKVVEDRGKLALEYGPVVFAFEEVDNPSIDDIRIGLSSHWSVEKNNDLLDGINILQGLSANNLSVTGIPYYCWSNRGIGKMKVWLPKS